MKTLLSLENTLYLALLGLALALRVWMLGVSPLTDSEAREALSVLHIVRGVADIAPHSPAYATFSYLAFLLFGAANVTARILPALFGSALVLVPASFKHTLGRWGALSASLLLALSASFIAASRSADGAMLSLTLLGLGVGCVWQYRQNETEPAWLFGGAVALGFGLASGGAFFSGVLILAVATLLTGAGREFLRETWHVIWPSRLAVALTLGVTLLITVTIFAAYPNGIGALSTSFTYWLTGFSLFTTSGRAWLTLPIFWAVYEPLVLALGLLGIARAYWRDSAVGKWLALATGVALLFSLLYSGRTLFDGLWVLLPLTLLAAWALVDVVEVNWQNDEWPQMAALAGVMSVLVVFALLNSAAFAEQVRSNPDLTPTALNLNGQTVTMSPVVYMWLSVLALVAAVLVAVLFGMGWSARAARVGAALTTACFGLIFALGAGWGLNQRQADTPLELWWAQPMSADVNRLLTTLENTSNFFVGQEREIEVTVQASPEGALAWALRDYLKARFVDKLDDRLSTPVVIAPMQAGEEQNPALGSAYVGQGFSVRYVWFPENLSTSEQFAWLAFRRVPDSLVSADRVILWVRQDVANLQTAQGAPAIVPEVQPAPEP